MDMAVIYRSEAAKEMLNDLNSLLWPLSRQKVHLRELNSEHNTGVPDNWFDDVDTETNHVQSIYDFEFFFVVPRSNLFNEAFWYNLRLLELAQDTLLYRGSSHDFSGMGLDHRTEKWLYAYSGIYRMRINLLSYWDHDNKNYQSVDTLRMEPASAKEKFVGLPAMGAYSVVDPLLFQYQDGIYLPYLAIEEIRFGHDNNHILRAKKEIKKCAGIRLELIHDEEIAWNCSFPTLIKD